MKTVAEMRDRYVVRVNERDAALAILVDEIYAEWWQTFEKSLQACFVNPRPISYTVVYSNSLESACVSGYSQEAIGQAATRVAHRFQELGFCARLDLCGGHTGVLVSWSPDQNV